MKLSKKNIIMAVIVASVFTSQTSAETVSDEQLARRLAIAGITLQQHNEHSAAIAYFERAQREVDHPKLSYFQGKSLDALNKPEQALRVFRKIEDAEENKKYALETRAYIRAIEAERKVKQLMIELVTVKNACTAKKSPNKVPWLLLRP